jgi:hypothetical protein
MRVSGTSKVVKTVKEFKYGSTDHFMKVTGKTIKLTVKVD